MRSRRRLLLLAGVAAAMAVSVAPGASAHASPPVPQSACPAETNTIVEGWVCMVHRLALGRAPRTDELAYWTGVANGAGGRARAAFGIEFSEEAVRLRVAEAYASQLRRLGSDSVGNDYWSAQITSSRSERRFESELLGSAEMRRTFPSSQAYVRYLYSYYLGRDADPGGMAYWAGRLDAGLISGPQLVSTFQASDEGARRTVTIAYLDILDRLPDPGGLAAFASRAAAFGLLRLEAELAGSDEALATLGAQGLDPSSSLPETPIEVTDAVFASAPVAPDSPCPTAPTAHQARAGSSGMVLVVCGRVLAPRPVGTVGNPGASSPGFVRAGPDPGGRVRPSAGPVVLGNVLNIITSDTPQSDVPITIDIGATTHYGRFWGTVVVELPGYSIVAA